MQNYKTTLFLLICAIKAVSTLQDCGFAVDVTGGGVSYYSSMAPNPNSEFKGDDVCTSDTDCPSIGYYCCTGTQWCCPHGYVCTGSATCISVGVIVGPVVAAVCILILIGIYCWRRRRQQATYQSM